MVDLYKELRRQGVLYSAWHRVRRNGNSSSSPVTRGAIAKFQENEIGNLKRIADQLRVGSFIFSPQRGIAPRKGGGKEARRPIVMAPVENRIVQRALLDVLQRHVPAIESVLNTETSIGGIPKRGTAHALTHISLAFSNGHRYFVRSDIADFFSKIPRRLLLRFMNAHVADGAFLKLLKGALETELDNLDELGSHRGLFPLGPDGVAQGSPLSPLMGNILLQEFDQEMNGRGIVCIRYIDDFLLLGTTQQKVKRAMLSARRHLARFNMDAYDPRDNPVKAAEGAVDDGFDFLGYQIHPGFLCQPSSAARKALIDKIERIIAEGRKHMQAVLKEEHNDLPRQRYIQTLDFVNEVIRGWGYAFKYSTARQVFAELDKQVDKELNGFHRFAWTLMRENNYRQRRRLTGVHLLEDTRWEEFPSTSCALQAA